MKTGQPVKYSVVVLVEEESPDFSDYIKTLHRIFSSLNEPFEMVIVANGLEGFLKKIYPDIASLAKVRAFALNKPSPQAVGFMAGFRETSGEIIVTCGSYQQLTVESLRMVLDSVDEETDIVSPWRRNRVDPSFSQFQSVVFNKLVRKISGAALNDLSCTVRVFRRKVLEETRVYGNMFRFLPIIAARKGFKIKEVQCEHFQERGKTGFYSLSMYVDRLIDIFTLYFNTRFTRKPLRFFGIIGSFFMVIGILLFLYVGLQKIFLHIQIGGRPLFVLAFLFMIFGMQASSVGLLGEIIAFTQGRHTKEYNIAKILGE